MFYIKLIVFAVILTLCMWYAANEAAEYIQDLIQRSVCGGESCANSTQVK